MNKLHGLYLFSALFLAQGAMATSISQTATERTVINRASAFTQSKSERAAQRGDDEKSTGQAASSKRTSAFVGSDGKPKSAFARDGEGKPVSSFDRRPPKQSKKEREAAERKRVFDQKRCKINPAFCETTARETVASPQKYAPPPPVESSDKHR